MFISVEEDQSRWFLFMQGKLDIIAVPPAFITQAVDENLQLNSRLKEKISILRCLKIPVPFGSALI